MTADNEPAAPVEPGQEPQNPPADNQQPADGPPDDGEPKPDDSVSRAELDKVIGQRQAAKDRARKAEETIADMKAKLDAMPDPETLEKFKAWSSDKAAQARDKAIKDGDVEAIEKGIREPMEAENTALKGKLSSRDAQLSSVLKDQALRTAAEESGAHNPSQVVALLRHRVTMTEQADGTFVPDYRDDQDQPLYDGSAQRVTDARTFVQMFLSQPENANLVKAQATPGSGAQPGGSPPPPPSDKPKTLEEWNALTPEQKAKIGPTLTREERDAMRGRTKPDRQGFI